MSNGLSDVSLLKFIPGIRVSPDAMSIDDVSQQSIVITGLDKVLQKVEVSFLCSFEEFFLFIFIETSFFFDGEKVVVWLSCQFL